MINMADDFSWISDLVNKGGGWAAFLLFLIIGGRAFMSLARDFSNKVVSSLERIQDAIVSQERRVDLMTERLTQVAEQVARQGEHIERLMRHLAAKIQDE